MPQLTPELQAFIRERMGLDGDYHVTHRASLEEHMRRLPPAPGDTVSVHPQGGGPPTLYEVDRHTQLRQIWPRESS